MSTSRRGQRYLALAALIFAGEMIFSLPFHVPRYFRPSVLEGFALSNAQLGDIFAVYGITAMLAYFPGGWLADRYPARNLICFSLIATSLGSLYLITLPGMPGLALLYGYWGVTTILLFWAALIRATREWGGSASQGRAFGLLDGGRGLAAAAGASIAVWFFSLGLNGTGEVITPEARASALINVVLFYGAATALAALAVWLWVPLRQPHADSAKQNQTIPNMAVLGSSRVWLQAGIVICAYCGYKGLDNYALYAHEILAMTEQQASQFTANAAYIRPLAAISAGLVADRVGASRLITVLFALVACVYVALAMLDPGTAGAQLVLANLLISFVAVFALRGVYFALLEQSRVPASATGIAVGLVSVVGYTPDIFFAPIAGRLLDATPGLGGPVSLLRSVAFSWLPFH